jgi:hypothetical protein
MFNGLVEIWGVGCNVQQLIFMDATCNQHL